MKVSFYATLRAIVGTKTVEIDVANDCSLQELLDAILARYPDLAPVVLDEGGQLSRRSHLMVKGRSSVHLEAGLATRLQGGEAIDFFPAVAGG
jgi:molybdopterin synthase sulfur carrier subunit